MRSRKEGRDKEGKHIPRNKEKESQGKKEEIGMEIYTKE